MRTQSDLEDGVVSPTPRTRPSIEREIVEVLDRSQTMAGPSARQLLLDQIQSEMGTSLSVRGQDVPRMHLAEIVRGCARFADGLSALAVVFNHLNTHAPESAELLRLVEEWQTLEFFSDVDLTPLRVRCLDELTVGAVLGSYRQATGGRRAELPEHCRNGWDVFTNLASLGSAPDSAPPTIQFLRLVEGRLPPARADAVRAFANRWISGWGLAEEVEHIGLDEDSGPVCLVVRIAPASDGYYLISHWRQGPSAEWRPVRQRDVEATRHRLEPVVEKLVNEAEVAWSNGPGSASLQFILPFELLDEPIECWLREPSTNNPTKLIVDYPVTIRSLERMQARHWHRPWHNRWKRLVERPESTRPYLSKPRGSNDRTQLERELKKTPDYVSLVLSEAPRSSGIGEDEIIAGLKAGLPVILWHRWNCQMPAFRTAAEDLLRADSSLAMVPSRARQWMLEVIDADGDEDTDRQWQIAVIFDDPTRPVDGSAEWAAR